LTDPGRNNAPADSLSPIRRASIVSVMTRQGSEPAHYGKSRPVVPSRRVGALKRASSISCNQMQFDQLKRRQFITLLGGAAAAWPLAARAQQPPMPVIGFLRSAPFVGAEHLVRAFRQGLNDTGFIEGQNVLIEYRSAEGYPSRLAPLASELVNRQVSVIFCDNIAALAAKAATKSIPIVFAGGGDAVQEGLVARLNRPDGNITGVNFFTGAIGTKRLDLLRQIVPNATKIGVLVQPSTPQTEAEREELEVTAQDIGQPLLVLRVTDAQEIEGAITRLVQWGRRSANRGFWPIPIFQSTNHHRRSLSSCSARELHSKAGSRRWRAYQLWDQPD
jgi:ABC transporter substrate binding protein